MLVVDIVFVVIIFVVSRVRRANLLVRRDSERSHDDVAFFRVDLGVQSGVSDHVDDPFFRVLLGHVQLLRQHADRDALVDSGRGC